MKITKAMRLERAMGYIENERKREKDALRMLEGIRLTEVIIMRNKKAMYIAELDQMIRNIREEIETAKKEETGRMAEVLA